MVRNESLGKIYEVMAMLLLNEITGILAGADFLVK